MNRTSRWSLIAVPALLLCCAEAWQPAACAQATANARARRNRTAATNAAAAKATPPPLATPTPAPADAEAAELSPPVDKGTNPAVNGADGKVSETEIIAMGGDGMESANFSSKDRIAVFYGQVRVTDPRFQLACDKLTVYLRKTKSNAPAAGGANATATTPAPLAAASPKPSTPGTDFMPGAGDAGGGIDYAIAEGHVVMVQDKPPETPGGEPKRSTAKSEWGKFDNNTGVMTLKGLPSVEQNGNLHIALSRDTVMLLSKEGGLKTTGPSRTLIVQKSGLDAPALGAPTTTRPRG